MIAALIPLFTAMVKPVSDAFSKRSDRKAAQDSLKSKAVLATINTKQQVAATAAEWEVIKARTEGGSWKDEYLTLVVTSPIAGIVLGSVWFAMTGESAMLDGSVAGIKALNEVGIPMPELMTLTVTAGIGLKLWKA